MEPYQPTPQDYDDPPQIMPIHDAWEHVRDTDAKEALEFEFSEINEQNARYAKKLAETRELLKRRKEIETSPLHMTSDDLMELREIGEKLDKIFGI